MHEHLFNQLVHESGSPAISFIESFYETQAMTTPVIIEVASLDGKYRNIFMNPGIENKLGIQRQSLLTDPYALQVHSDDQEKLNISMDSLYKTGKPVSGEYRIINSTGDKYMWFNVDTAFVSDTKGVHQYLLSILKDITPQVEERQLNKALIKVSNVLSTTTDIDKIIDAVEESILDLVPHDTANFMLLEKNDSKVIDASIRRSWDRREPKGDPPAESLSDKIKSTLQKICDTKNPIIFPDVKNATSEWDPDKRNWVGSYIGIPIEANGEVVAVLNFNHHESGFYNNKHVEYLQLFAKFINEAFVLYHREHRDYLTGLYDREYFETTLKRELKRALRFQREFSLLFIDPDHFKEINDNLGHGVGDEYKKSIAELLQNAARDIDTVALWGGDECVMILPETNTIGALTLAERIRLGAEVFVNEFNQKHGLKLPISIVTGAPSGTLSIAVATFPHDTSDSGSIDGIMNAVDEALYRAKTKRNAICAASNTNEIKRAGKILNEYVITH